MNLERYTRPAQQVILSAQQWAQEHGHPAIEPAHLLLALVRPADGVVPAIVTRLAGSPALLIDDIERDLARRPRVQGEAAASPGLSRAAAESFSAAERQAASMKDDYVST
jgi:ATP-dependent Clp protease ATP-binding subunit ClpB